MPDWIPTHSGYTDNPAANDTMRLTEQLHAERATVALLQEGLADLQLALEDKGWSDLSTALENDFTAAGRKAMTRVCRHMAVANPLIKRGLLTRIGYIWGQSVEVRARAAGDDQASVQDLNAVVQKFIADNTATLFGDDAHAQHEHALGTDGNVYLAAFTHPLTGAVKIRASLSEEIADIITNPEDRDETWYFIRHVPKRIVEPGYTGQTRTRSIIEKVAHPALGYYPRKRPKSIDGVPVRWDAPIKQVKVNALPGGRFGIPDVYAAIGFARAYKEFLVDWAQLTHSLAQFAWQATGGTRSRAQKIAQEIARSKAQSNGSGTIGPVPPVGAAPAGQTAAGTPDVKLEAISKSGATIDANSGKPLAGMAAAGMGIPVTILLADPGVTGARAVAETLDLPTVLEMGMRRLLWQAALTDLIGYAIDQAVIAPRGPLRGTLVRDEWDQLVTVLAGDVERTLDWAWPPLISTDPVELIKAIVEAAGTDLIPDLVTLGLLLDALGVKDADEVIASVTDENGRFIDTRLDRAAEAIEGARRLAGYGRSA